MKLITVRSYFWKLPLCVVAYITGMAFGGAAMTRLGLQPQVFPASTDARMMVLSILLGSLCLSFIARRLHVRWQIRWMILAELTWLIGMVGIIVESIPFVKTGLVFVVARIVLTLCNFLLPSVLIAGVVAALFQPEQGLNLHMNRSKEHPTSRSWRRNLVGDVE